MSTFSILVFLLFVALSGIILSLLLQRSHPQPTVSQGDYSVKPLLTQAEQRVYNHLTTATPSKYRILAQVRLADILEPRVRSWKTLQPILSKSVDFVLCDKRTWQPLIVVELDDSSHKFPDRMRRDAFVNEALQQAGLRVVRQPVQKDYNQAKLSAALGT